MLFILNYLLVAGLAKSIGNTLKFYNAALIYALVMAASLLMFSSAHSLSAALVYGAIKFVVAIPIFYLLDRYSDTFFTWLLIFGAGATVLIFI